MTRIGSLTLPSGHYRHVVCAKWMAQLRRDPVRRGRAAGAGRGIARPHAAGGPLRSAGPESRSEFAPRSAALRAASATDHQARHIRHGARGPDVVIQPQPARRCLLVHPDAARGGGCVVVAQRGQTVMGRVAEAQKSKAGHDSRLGLELDRPDPGGWLAGDGALALVARRGPPRRAGSNWVRWPPRPPWAQPSGLSPTGVEAPPLAPAPEPPRNHRRPADPQPPQRRLSGNRADVSHRDASGGQYHTGAAGLPLRGPKRLPAPG